jgi:hypothetical protein
MIVHDLRRGGQMPRAARMPQISRLPRFVATGSGFVLAARYKAAWPPLPLPPPILPNPASR